MDASTHHTSRRRTIHTICVTAPHVSNPEPPAAIECALCRYLLSQSGTCLPLWKPTIPSPNPHTTQIGQTQLWSVPHRGPAGVSLPPSRRGGPPRPYYSFDQRHPFVRRVLLKTGIKHTIETPPPTHLNPDVRHETKLGSSLTEPPPSILYRYILSTTGTIPSQISTTTIASSRTSSSTSSCVGAAY